MHLQIDVFKIAVSILLGSVIGLEREVSDKAAGLRTNVLICVGAALFTVLSGKFTGPTSDPARIATPDSATDARSTVWSAGRPL